LALFVGVGFGNLWITQIEPDRRAFRDVRVHLLLLLKDVVLRSFRIRGTMQVGSHARQVRRVRAGR
jgi:hypothetical protein